MQLNQPLPPKKSHLNLANHIEKVLHQRILGIVFLLHKCPFPSHENFAFIPS